MNLLARTENLIDVWYHSALRFVTEAIGAEPTEQQERVLSVVKPGNYVSIRSGHGVGKTALLAW